MEQCNQKKSNEFVWISYKKNMSRGRPGITALMCTMFFVLFIASVQAQDTTVMDMKKFYQTTCAKCHGPDGSAVGEDGKRLKGEDFTNQKWQQDTKDEEMIKVIMKGKFFGLAMPAFKDMLTNEEAQLIVSEIIRKSKKGEIIAPDTE